MKKSHVFLSIGAAAFALSAVFVSCKKEKPQVTGILEQEPDLSVVYDYSEKHGVADNVAMLGRVLFYDKNLSVNNTVSCGSCHKQQFAFADNVRFNKGFNGMDLKRNSPSIQGIRGFARNNGGFFVDENGNFVQTTDVVPTDKNQEPVLLFWDGRQSNVANMVLNPVLNHNEMNIPDFETLINKLNTLSYYPSLFQKAFGEAAITKEKIAYAMQGFIACLNADQDPMQNFNGNFNGNMNGQFPAEPIFASTLTPMQEQGRQLFHTKYNCAKCHDPSNSGSYGAVVSPTQMFNIGLDENYTDNGLGAITRKEGDKGLFKVPTLKNISVTGPYMHDGRFNTLAEVIDHYSHNIKPNRNLSSQFINFDGSVKKLNILPVEKQALIAFLNTLKDEDFLTSPMYSDPFKK